MVSIISFIGILLLIILVTAIIYGYPIWQILAFYDIKNVYLNLFIYLGFMFLVFFSMIINNFFSNIVTSSLKKLITYWLGIGFLLFFIVLFFKIIRHFVQINPNVILALIILTTLMFTIIGMYNSTQININTIELQSNKITKNYRIIQLSDIHLGSNSKSDLEQIVSKVNTLNPDLILITGDLVDENSITKYDLEPFNQIKKPMYLINGNHEFYLKKTNIQNLISNTNITYLRNEISNYSSDIQIIGVDDNTNLTKALDNLSINTSKYSILMHHSPKETDAANNKKIDLMLSGHTHNGQIFPFKYLVRLQFKYVYGLFNLGNTTLYVTSGTQTWGPKMRLGTQNEIVLFELKKSS